MSLPLMRPHKTFPLFLSACCLSLPLTQGGCDGDVDAADGQVREHIAEGEQKTDSAVLAAPGVPDGYKKAAGVVSASPAAKVEALSRLAAAERDRALALMGEADRFDSELLRLVGATNRQSIRIQSNNSLIAGLARMEPTKATQAIEEQRKAAEGEQKPVWVEHETGPLLARKGLEAEAAKLQEQIAQLEGQAKDLAAQRSKLIADAEQIEKQSDQARGQESGDLYNQSVDARKQAADLAVQAEAVEAKLLPLRQDLERVQANLQAVTGTVEAFGGQLQATQQNWQKVQEQIAELQKLNQKILNGTGGAEPAASAPTAAPSQPGQQPEADPAAGDVVRPAAPAAPAAPIAPSISGKLRQVNELVTQIEDRRTEAESLLKQAIEHTTQAATAAASVVSSVSSQMNASGGARRPERSTWQQMTELHNPFRFKLRHASLQILLADLYRGRASDLDARNNMVQLLTAALQPAQLPVPQEAGANLQAEAEAARAASNALYNEAEKELQEVVQAPKSGDLVGDAAKAAHLMQLVRLYAQAQSDPQAAAGLAARARSLAAEGEQVQLPAAALPSFVQDALELRTPPAAATRPGGTTQPAGAVTPPATTPPAPGTPPPAPATTPPDPATPPPDPATPPPTPAAADTPAAAPAPPPGAVEGATPTPAPATPPGQ